MCPAKVSLSKTLNTLVQSNFTSLLQLSNIYIFNTYGLKTAVVKKAKIIIQTDEGGSVNFCSRQFAPKTDVHSAYNNLTSIQVIFF